jgi:hypothetical protein
MLKVMYVSFIRKAGVVARKVGLLSWLENYGDLFFPRYVRSLFSIYDAADMAKLDLPWWTFSAINHVDSFLRSRSGGAIVFEYGSGASTVWLSKRSRQVTYVEHDFVFFEFMKTLTADISNVVGHFAEPTRSDNKLPLCPSSRTGFKGADFLSYVSTIQSANGPFDLIVVDGRARQSCLKEAIKHLKPDGMILFDNSHRSRYKNAIKESGLEASVYRGLAPALPYIEETTILKVRSI